MAFAPLPPPMAPMQFAQGPNLAGQLQALAKAGTPVAAMAGRAVAPNAPLPVDPGSAVPGAVGPTAAGGPNGPQPLVAPGVTPMGPPSPMAAPAQSPSLVDAVRGMAPQQILDVLRGMTMNSRAVIPPGQPGSVALQGAGMMPSTFGG